MAFFRSSFKSPEISLIMCLPLTSPHGQQNEMTLFVYALVNISVLELGWSPAETSWTHRKGRFPQWQKEVLIMKGNRRVPYISSFIIFGKQTLISNVLWKFAYLVVQKFTIFFYLSIFIVFRVLFHEHSLVPCVITWTLLFTSFSLCIPSVYITLIYLKTFWIVEEDYSPHW